MSITTTRHSDPSRDDNEQRRHRRVLLLLTLLSRSLSTSLIYLASHFLPLFDSSPKLLQLHELAAPHLRWDTFHFLSIAQNGYAYEQQWAFMPGVPLVMRFIGKLMPYTAVPPTASDLLLSGALAVLACDCTHTLYMLSLHHLGSANLAFIASALSLIPSGPATLHFTPYAEPFFTYLSYKGMLHASHSQWLLATICFALATAFRSNGVLLGGFLIWGIIARPFLERRTVSISALCQALIFTSVVSTPFIYHNYTAYTTFCVNKVSSVSINSAASIASSKPAWCSNTFPIIYSHVQSTYWNVGFLRYWTASQLPNFAIAAPPLLLLFSFSIRHVSRIFIPQMKAYISTLAFTHTPGQRRVPADAFPRSFPVASVNSIFHSYSPFLSPSLTPHVIHSLVFCSVLLLASHTQIVLRLAASMPLTYWAAARLMVEKPIWGFAWVMWNLVWSSVSVVLWTVFLPPA